MTDDEAIRAAASFLVRNEVPFVEPGSVVKRPDGLLEVIFMVPEAFDPHSVVDPPDVWVLVDPASGNASLIPIM